MSQKENKLGSMPINKLLIQISLPIMISMLVQALYNIVDSMFVAQYSEDALTAVSLAFPVQMLMLAVAIGTGVGVNAFLSRKLGEHDRKTASDIANHSIFLALISFLLFALFGIFFSHLFFKLSTKNAIIQTMGTNYVSIVTIFSFGLFGQICCERIMQSCGSTIYNMIIQCIGAILNIILDPILIFGLFGFPRLGIAGAAIATVIGQITAFTIGIFLLKHKVHDIDLTYKGFRPNKEIIKTIYVVGFPAIIMQSIVSFMTMGMNLILGSFSEVAVSVFGIYYKLQSFIFMPVFGLTNGMVPIISYNFGARQKERIIKTVKLSTLYSVFIMFIGTLIFQFFPSTLLRIFNANEEMIAIGVVALRTISACFCFAGVSIVLSSVFQALGNGVYSLITSIVRQLVVILPVAYLLGKLFGLHAVWLSFPISEVVCLALTLFFLKHVWHNYLDPLPSN